MGQEMHGHWVNFARSDVRKAGIFTPKAYIEAS